MKTVYSFFIAFLFVAFVQAQEISLNLKENKNLQLVDVEAVEEQYKGKPALKLTDPGGNSEAKFVKINGVDFKNGTIEAEIAGSPAEGSMEQARGFVGVAFRINENNSKFNCFYLRPTNGRAEDQLRRNHSVQYISFPDHPWNKLRKDFPGLYETYVDLVPGEWTKIKIVIKDDTALLFVHGNEQPTLIVNGLLGDHHSGVVGLWVGPGTEAYFSNLVITNSDKD